MSIDRVCEDLKALDGAVGAFVWHRGECVASSMPKSYDLARLGNMGTEISRFNQLAHKAGYERASSVFQWQKAMLLTWPIGRASVLGILAQPSAVRGVLELSCAMAAEDLVQLLESEAITPAQPAAASAPVAAAAPAPAAPAPVNTAASASAAAQTLSQPGHSAPGASPAPSGAASDPKAGAQAEAATPARGASPPLPRKPAAEDPALRQRMERIEQLLISEMGPNGRLMFQRLKQKACQPGAPESVWVPRLRQLILAEVTDLSVWTTVAASVHWVA